MQQGAEHCEGMAEDGRGVRRWLRLATLMAFAHVLLPVVVGFLSYWVILASGIDAEAIVVPGMYFSIGVTLMLGLAIAVVVFCLSINIYGGTPGVAAGIVLGGLSIFPSGSILSVFVLHLSLAQRAK